MTKTTISNHFFGCSVGVVGAGAGALGTNGWPVSCWVIFAGAMTAGWGAATNGCAVECCVRVVRSVFSATGAALTTNGSWDMCSNFCIIFSLSLINHGFFGFGFTTNGLLEACSVFPTKRTADGAVDLILVAGFVWLFFGGCI